MCTVNNIANNYSIQLEQYRQSGDICAFLNIKQFDLCGTNKFPQKFAAFEAAGFHLSNSSLLELLFPSMLRQFIMARCLFEQVLNQSNSQGALIGIALKELQGGPAIISGVIFPSTMAMVGILFNFSLLIVTAKKISMSTMSTMCNWLLAYDSLCQIPAVSTLPINMIAFLIRSSVDYRVCLVSQMLSTGASYASFLSIFFMSLERLLIVMMPMRMSQFSEKTIKQWSLLAMLACTCFGVVMILMLYNVRTDLIDASLFGSPIACNTMTLVDTVSINYYVTPTILGLALLNYVLIAGLIAWRRIYKPGTLADSNNNAAYSQATYRMLRSVFIISVVLLIGWLFGVVLFNQINKYIIIPMTKKLGQMLYPDDWMIVNIFNTTFLAPKKADSPGPIFSNNLSNLLNNLIVSLFPISAGMNAPVLIVNNSDYRDAYKKTLAPLLRICRRRTATVAVGPLFINHHHQ